MQDRWFYETVPALTDPALTKTKTKTHTKTNTKTKTREGEREREDEEANNNLDFNRFISRLWSIRIVMNSKTQMATLFTQALWNGNILQL